MPADRTEERIFFTPYGNPRLEDGPEGEHLPDRLATETVRFMQAHRDRPFLAYLSFYSVHTPLIGRPDLVEKYQKKAEQLGLLDQEQFADEEQVWPVKQPRQVRVVQSHAVYAAMVEAMDQAVGKVLRGLEELGLDQNTVVFFTSDNGGLSTSEGSPHVQYAPARREGLAVRGRHSRALSDQVARRHSPGQHLGRAGHQYGLLPDDPRNGKTARPARAAQGRCESGSDPERHGRLGRDALYWHYPHYSNQGGFPGGAIRMGDYKLIERYEDGRVHLYNLAEDIGEREDLAEQFPERVQAMRQRLHAWYTEVDAKFLEPLPDGPEPWRP
jgi:arylsulfatase A-like enzyme